MNTLANSLVSRACDIIRDPGCWTQLTAARDHVSRAVSPRSPEAQKFCGFGALARAAHERNLSEQSRAEIFSMPVLVRLIQMNDREDHAAVLDYPERLGPEAGGGLGLDL
jgi:hypothetical protein